LNLIIVAIVVLKPDHAAMYQYKLERTLNCGVGVTMEVIGGKWKPCIIDSIRKGLKRPSELHRVNPNATPRVINQQLRELESHGIVQKIIYPVLPPKVEYSLTEKGQSLLFIIDAMEKWGAAFGDEVRALIGNSPGAQLAKNKAG
jgi:DNA-binding HxlR family transcriptional regulator